MNRLTPSAPTPSDPIDLGTTDELPAMGDWVEDTSVEPRDSAHDTVPSPPPDGEYARITLPTVPSVGKLLDFLDEETTDPGSVG